MIQLINITFGLCISVFTRHLLLELSSHYSIFSSLLALIQEQILTKEHFAMQVKGSILTVFLFVYRMYSCPTPALRGTR